MRTPAGSWSWRKESECGQMGVTMMAGTDGCTSEPPALAAYAVLPVGVEMIRPARPHTHYHLKQKQKQKQSTCTTTHQHPLSHEHFRNPRTQCSSVRVRVAVS